MAETESSTVQVVQTYYDILTGGMATFDPACRGGQLPSSLVCSIVRPKSGQP